MVTVRNFGVMSDVFDLGLYRIYIYVINSSQNKIKQQ
jgi:hypothetical protein